MLTAHSHARMLQAPISQQPTLQQQQKKERQQW